jgi:hypothetical protein
VLYGKVIHFSEGSSLQVFSGGLDLMLVDIQDPLHVVTLHTALRPTGDAGAYSYRLEIPQKYLPTGDDLDDALAVGPAEVQYELQSLRVDGYAAQPLDSAQALLTTSFAGRAGQHRLDLKVNLPQEDLDGDGIPDWWERLHGLNWNFAGDGTEDFDGDGLDNRTEFTSGTDPNLSNILPTVQTTSLLVPCGGEAGLYLHVVDSDTDPADILLTVDDAVAGLTFWSPAGQLQPGVAVTYADILSGEIYLTISPDFVSADLSVSVDDPLDGAVAKQVSIDVTGFSPATQIGPRPALWLHAHALAGQVAPQTAVAEWPDQSTAGRDGYQPLAERQPVFDQRALGSLDFTGDDFLYLDDKDLALHRYTTFIAFDMSDTTPADQSLFNSSDLRVAVGGTDNAIDALSIRITENGRMINGPAIAPNETMQLTVVGDEESSFLSVLGQTLYPSSFPVDDLDPAFVTIGGRRTFADADIRETFQGGMYEVLVYDEVLEPGHQSRNTDYQLSRWSTLIVWDYRDQTSAVAIHGASAHRNSLNGGWGNDSLTGGDLSDILRGGPGHDRLRGGDGADRFQFFIDHGDDMVGDFSEADGDILDLTPIFADQRGSPDEFLHVHNEVRRGKDDVPVAVTVLEVNYDGTGSTVDQTIILEDQQFSDADLPRLVGEGVIQLGGPQFETSISLASSESDLVETEVPRTLTVTRTGNLDAALDVTLAFAGSAGVGIDYFLSSAAGSGMIRTISFARGEGSTQIDLTPIQDVTDESEQIHIAVLALPQITGLPGSPLVLNLEDAPEVMIAALVDVAQRTGAVPGILELTRGGALDEPLTIALTFGGEGVNGQDYELISPNQIIPAGARTRQIEMRPLSPSAFVDQTVAVQVGIVPDTTRFAMKSPGSAWVTILDFLDDQFRDFGTWRQIHFPGNTSPTLFNENADGDTLNNGMEYVFATDPKALTDGSVATIELLISEGDAEIHAITASGLTDLDLGIEFSSDMHHWQRADELFAMDLRSVASGQLVERIYRPFGMAGLDNENLHYRFTAFGQPGSGDPGRTCTFDVQPPSPTIHGDGGVGAIQVNVDDESCAWGVSEALDWLSITGIDRGVGAGQVEYTVDPNPDVHERSGIFYVAGMPIEITQAAPCTFTVSPTIINIPYWQSSCFFGGIPVTITTQAGCEWTASESASWLSLSPNSGTGSGTTQIGVEFNYDPAARATVMNVAGIEVHVRQEAPATWMEQILAFLFSIVCGEE